MTHCGRIMTEFMKMTIVECFDEITDLYELLVKDHWSNWVIDETFLQFSLTRYSPKILEHCY